MVAKLIERLEQRCLLAITVTEPFPGEVHITGDSADDQVSVIVGPSGYPATWKVNVNNTHIFHNTFRTEVKTLSGDDTINVTYIPANTNTYDLVVQSGSGNDTLNLTATDFHISQALSVFDPSGADTYHISGGGWFIEDSSGGDDYLIADLDPNGAPILIHDSPRVRGEARDALFIEGGADVYAYPILEAPTSIFATMPFGDYFAEVNDQLYQLT